MATFDLSLPNPGPVSFPEELDPARIKRIHVVAVAGTGMGSFAGLLRQAGYTVTGSDENIYPPMSEKLPEWGISVMPGFSPDNVTAAQPDLVVIGNVVRKVNIEATAVRERGLPHASFPATLGRLFLEQRRGVVVAGTHGKTTTTSLLAHLLTVGGRDPSFLVGGVPRNFTESFRVGQGREFVVEGDEYDTAYFDKGPKFLHYRPFAVQFTGAEFDHADIYHDMDHYESSFRRLFDLVPADGLIAACTSFHNTAALIAQTGSRVATYSARTDAQWRAVDIEMGPEGSRFTLQEAGTTVGRFFLPMHGLHNVENATGAAVIALSLGIDLPRLTEGLATFAGVRRRQERVAEAGGVVLVDDFAHHPTAVRETISAIAARYPGRRLWALFEPRSNTASRAVHRDEYARAFDGAAEVLLSAPRKVSGLAADQVLDIASLAADISSHAGTRARATSGAAEIQTIVTEEMLNGDVLLVMSNGAFDGLVPKLKAVVEARST